MQVIHERCAASDIGRSVVVGLGFATERADAWVNGGSPTSGYLNFATEGKTFHDFFASVASPAADWLFMIGLLGIGLALILGIGMWIAAISGSVMLVLMWAAALPLENNPFMDGHIIYALVLVALAIYGAGRTWTRAYLGGTPHRPQAAHPQVTRTHAPRAGGRNSAAGRLGTAVLVPPSSYRRAHPAARLSNERASVCLHT